jgi:hypothetical protein
MTSAGQRSEEADMAQRRFASTHWEVDDVLNEAKEAGLRMTKKEAEEFLVSNE